MSRPSRLGHQAAQTFESIPQVGSSSLEPPVWMVLPMLYWSRCQLAWLEAVEPLIH